jgi:hypothetical protein
MRRKRITLESDGTRYDRYIQYGEKGLIYAFLAAISISMIMVYWDGWVEGTNEYNKAQRDLNFCNIYRGAIIEEEAMGISTTCDNMKLVKIPSMYAVKYVGRHVFETIVQTICTIGGSWLSSITMGVLISMAITYLYGRVTTPSRWVSSSSSPPPTHQYDDQLMLSQYPNHSYPTFKECSTAHLPGGVEFTMCTPKIEEILS